MAIHEADDRQTLERFFAEEYLAFARSRRIQSEDAASLTLKALCQAMFWACALDEWLRANRDRYERFLETDRAADELGGLKYARNVAAHQFQCLFRVTGGATFPIEVPPVFHEYKWKAASEIPHATSHGRRLRPLYERHLAGKPARFALKALKTFFERARKEIG